MTTRRNTGAGEPAPERDYGLPVLRMNPGERERFEAEARGLPRSSSQPASHRPVILGPRRATWEER